MPLQAMQPAPDFTAPAVMPDDRIEESFRLGELRDQYVVLLFYPEDFTHVCPTEILAFDEALGEFGKRQTTVVGISIDPAERHLVTLQREQQAAAMTGRRPVPEPATRARRETRRAVHPG